MTNFNFSDIIEWDALSEAERTDILRRPAVMAGDKITAVVSGILDEVESRGDAALRDFSAKFDRTEVKNFKVSKAEVDAAISRLSPEFIKALQTAAKNIEKFHSAEVLETVTVETMPGVVCQQVTRPIGAVGLYIPGGTAPLFSTVLMLGIPAKIAGCSRVILCSPPPIADPILAAARLCGIDEIYQVGGAQAIAAMAFGTETIPSVSKIFGPGNAYVTEAKRQVSRRPDGAAIDMPAGPSEVLVIADAEADPRFVAADLLSQAEHGPDSQVVLLTPSKTLAKAIAAMAFGTETIPSVSKIFGPGNAYVTEAKRQVSRRPDGAAIDMPAGPSEVLVIADAEADPRFVAADLLSQAEHGPDSQVVLLTPSKTLAKAVAQAAAKELETLPRRAIAEKSLSASRLIVVKDLKECVEVSNRYAPEHLILQTRNARELVPFVQNAGSVFVGDWSPESGGDYATGTNHVLPTYGCAAAYSSLGLADFTKRMTVQEMTPQGFSELGEAIAILAHAEQLDAHRNAVLVRLEKLSKKIGG